MKRICLKCEKETPDTPCPYCGGGKFQNIWDYEPPEHLPSRYVNYHEIGFCPRCLMSDEEASEKDCFYPNWYKEKIKKVIDKFTISERELGEGFTAPVCHYKNQTQENDFEFKENIKKEFGI